MTLVDVCDTMIREVTMHDTLIGVGSSDAGVLLSSVGCNAFVGQAHMLSLDARHVAVLHKNDRSKKGNNMGGNVDAYCEVALDASTLCLLSFFALSPRRSASHYSLYPTLVVSNLIHFLDHIFSPRSMDVLILPVHQAILLSAVKLCVYVLCRRGVVCTISIHVTRTGWQLIQQENCLLDGSPNYRVWFIRTQNAKVLTHWVGLLDWSSNFRV